MPVQWTFPQVIHHSLNLSSYLFHYIDTFMCEYLLSSIRSLCELFFTMKWLYQYETNYRFSFSVSLYKLPHATQQVSYIFFLVKITHLLLRLLWVPFLYLPSFDCSPTLSLQITITSLRIVRHHISVTKVTK